MTNRQKALNLIARQCAMFQGQIFDKLTTQRQREFQTLASNILATTERLQTSFKWEYLAHWNGVISREDARGE